MFCETADFTCPKSPESLIHGQMKTPSDSLNTRRAKPRKVSLPVRWLRFTFIAGPCILLTSHISLKTASLMALLSAPGILCASLFTLPAFLFRSPQQQEYFHFANMLELEPARWLLVGLSLVCCLFSLALPAAQVRAFKAA